MYKALGSISRKEKSTRTRLVIFCKAFALTDLSEDATVECIYIFLENRVLLIESFKIP